MEDFSVPHCPATAMLFTTSYSWGDCWSGAICIALLIEFQGQMKLKMILGFLEILWEFYKKNEILILIKARMMNKFEELTHAKFWTVSC